MRFRTLAILSAPKLDKCGTIVLTGGIFFVETYVQSKANHTHDKSEYPICSLAQILPKSLPDKIDR